MYRPEKHQDMLQLAKASIQLTLSSAFSAPLDRAVLLVGKIASERQFRHQGLQFAGTFTYVQGL